MSNKVVKGKAKMKKIILNVLEMNKEGKQIADVNNRIRQIKIETDTLYRERNYEITKYINKIMWNKNVMDDQINERYETIIKMSLKRDNDIINLIQNKGKYLAETILSHKKIKLWIDIFLKFNKKEKWENDYAYYKYFKERENNTTSDYADIWFFSKQVKGILRMNW